MQADLCVNACYMLGVEMNHTFIAPRDNDLLLKAISLVDKPHSVVIKPYRSSRTRAQVALLNIWCREVSMEYQKAYGHWIPADNWKLSFYKGYGVVDVITSPLDGTAIEIMPSINDMDIEEASKFLEWIDHTVGSEFDIILTRPEEWKTAHGRNIPSEAL